MTHCRRYAAAAAAAWSLCNGSPLVGQTVGTLEIGASVVEYDGFLTSGAAVLSPALRYDRPNLALGLQGTWVVFESGNEILQGTAAAAWLSPPRGRWRAELSGSVGAAQYADASAFGHVLGRTRVHYHGERSGAWASTATGWSFDRSNAAPFELGIGGWTVHHRLALASTVSRSWRDTTSYVDVAAAARWTAQRVVVDAQALVRPWAVGLSGAGQGLYGEISALISLGPRIDVALSGGRYPTDPVRGVLAATYLSAGLRLSLRGSRSATVPVVTPAMVRASRELAASEHGSAAILEIEPAGPSQLVRVHAPGATSVQIMGDFTDWQPAALARAGGGTWQIQLTIAQGVHRLNVRIDGGPWLVPQGTRLEETEFGSAVGVVVVR